MKTATQQVQIRIGQQRIPVSYHFSESTPALRGRIHLHCSFLQGLAPVRLCEPVSRRLLREEQTARTVVDALVSEHFLLT